MPKTENFQNVVSLIFQCKNKDKNILKMPSLTLWSRILCKIYPRYRLAGTFWILRGRDLKVTRTLNLLIWSQTRYQLRHEASPVFAKEYILGTILWSSLFSLRCRGQLYHIRIWITCLISIISHHLIAIKCHCLSNLGTRPLVNHSLRLHPKF